MPPRDQNAWRERERERAGKSLEKELSLWSQPLDKGAFSRCKKKELIQLLLAGPTSARPRPDQTNAVRWRRLFSFPRIPRESGSLFCRRRATLTPAPLSRRFFPPKEKGKNNKKKKKKNNQHRRRRKPTRNALARPTMNEIGSGAFAFTAALMVSSTRLERLCVSMYSWIDISL